MYILELAQDCVPSLLVIGGDSPDVTNQSPCTAYRPSFSCPAQRLWGIPNRRQDSLPAHFFVIARDGGDPSLIINRCRGASSPQVCPPLASSRLEYLAADLLRVEQRVKLFGLSRHLLRTALTTEM